MISNFLYHWQSAIKSSDLSATTKHLLLTLATYMRSSKLYCHPIITDLMTDCSLSNRVIILHLKIAEDSGFIKTEIGHFTGQQWRRSTYFPFIPSAKSEV